MLLGWARSLMLGVMILLHGAFGTSSTAALPEPERPLISIMLTVDESAINEFVEQLKKFGEAGSFALRVVHTRRDDKHFLVELWRGDVNISAINPFDDPKQFSLAVYQTGVENVSPAQIDTLIKDIEGAISKVNGVTVVAIKRP
jgi:hypothetical protein